MSSFPIARNGQADGKYTLESRPFRTRAHRPNCPLPMAVSRALTTFPSFIFPLTFIRRRQQAPTCRVINSPSPMRVPCSMLSDAFAIVLCPVERNNHCILQHPALRLEGVNDTAEGCYSSCPLCLLSRKTLSLARRLRVHRRQPRVFLWYPGHIRAARSSVMTSSTQKRHQ